MLLCSYEGPMHKCTLLLSLTTDSHQDVFYYLYEMVPVGGYIIFDDIMSHAAVQEAWADFRKDQNFEEEIIPIDNHCGYFRKSKAIKVDMSKMHPAKDTNKKP